ncbi:MAG: HAD family phosphatase [Kastovskya adunca ATA6-11-RM4]|jgi:HAD superfamily hydrolase (TIGR01509 family)|nr:HAD family phosphatase [Kastovskya adunca ATA6-11-RM4]
MTLKVVLFDFNGVIINDEKIHQQLVEEILIAENLRFNPRDYREVCLGRSDRACLTELLERRGRILSESSITQLMRRKAQAYQQQLESLKKLPIYSGLEDLIYQLRVVQVPMAIVSGALRSEVELVLERSNLGQHFSTIVSGDDIKVSKPEPDGYLLAVEKLNQQFPELRAQASDCLAIEDTPAGIEAAKRAGMQVVGVANTYPFQMMQRQANWAVDYLSQLDVEWVQQVYAQPTRQSLKEC